MEDRATAAILALCLAHPAFSGILSGLDDRGAIVFREDLEGRTFASIVEDDADFIPIAVARGSGESLNPSFAPPPDRPVEPGEVVVAAGGGPGEDETRAVPGGVGGADADDGLGERVRRTAAAADTVTYEPLPSGPRRLLIVGWSDAAASFVGEMLGLTGVAELAVLDEQRPCSLPERIGDITPSFIRGRPDEPADLAAAVETANPDAILVAASREGDAAAAFTALRLERHFRAGAGSQAVRRPAIVVQQSEADGAGRLRMGLEWTHVVSSAELTGQTVGYSAGSPETLAVLERMAEGGMHRVVIAPGAESPDGKQQHPGFDFATVYRRLLQDGMAPFALARDGRLIDFSLDAGTAIRPGDEFLVVRRNGGPPA